MIGTITMTHMVILTMILSIKDTIPMVDIIAGTMIVMTMKLVKKEFFSEEMNLILKVKQKIKKKIERRKRRKR
jgi:hypothetical protein